MITRGPYTIQYDPRALKELIKLDKAADLWRIRVGDYRVV